MYERFTDRARKVMQLANQEAQRFNHEYIGTEHILLALVAEGSGVAANVLKNLDVDLAIIRAEVRKIVQSGPEAITGKLPPTPRAKKVMEYAIEESHNLNHNYVGTEHLLLGLLREDEGVGAQVLVNLNLSLTQVRKEVLNLLGTEANDREPAATEQRTSKRNTRSLDAHGKDLTVLARLGKLEPLFGRQPQLQAMADVLGCRALNSLALVGEPGVGKTALVAGLAQAIASRLAPDWLDSHRIVELSFSRLWTNVRSEAAFDETLQRILTEARRGQNVVLFLSDALRLLAKPPSVPELHALYPNWLGAIQPAEVRCILAGTSAEYTDSLARTPQLARCCQQILVPPATVEETLSVVRGLRDRYERHHNVQFAADALPAVAEFADRHLAGALPGKALLLLDRAAVRGRRKGAQAAREIYEAVAQLTEKVERIKVEKENAVAEQAFDRAAQLRDQGDRLTKQLDALVLEEKRRRQEHGGTITAADVAETVRDLTGALPANASSQITAIQG